MDYSKLSNEQLLAIANNAPTSSNQSGGIDYASMSDEQLLAIAGGSAPAQPEAGSGGILGYGINSLVRTFTDIPGDLAELFLDPDQVEGSFAKGLSDTVGSGVDLVTGVDRTKPMTTAEQVGQIGGSLVSYLLPQTAAVKLATVPANINKIGRTGAGLLGAAGGLGQQNDMIRDAKERGIVMTPEQETSARLFGLGIGVSEIATLGKFMKPIESLLSKIPLSKAGAAEGEIASGLKRAARAGTEEAAQESLAQLAQNLTAKGIYDPDLDPTEGLLGNAAGGAGAGVGMSVILDLLTKGKSARAKAANNDLSRVINQEAQEGVAENARADGEYGLEQLLKARPKGEIRILEGGEGANNTFDLVDSKNRVHARLQSLDAAIDAGTAYELAAKGKATFTRPVNEIIKDIPAPLPPKVGDTLPDGTKVKSVTKKTIDGQTTLKVNGKPFQPTPIANTPAPAAVAPSQTALAGSPAAVGGLSEPTSQPVETRPETALFNESAADEGSAYLDEGGDRGAMFNTAPSIAPPPAPAPAPAAPVVAPNATTAVPPVGATVEQTRIGSRVQNPAALLPTQQIVREEIKSRASAKLNSLTPEVRQTLAETAAKRVSALGLPEVQVKLKKFIRGQDPETGNVQYARGAAFVDADGNHVVELATDIFDPSLTPEQLTNKVMEILNHEVIHSFVNLGVIKPGEIKTLFEATERVKYPGSKFSYYDRAFATYARVKDYSTNGVPNVEKIAEEAVAEMFRDANAGRLSLDGSAKGILSRIVNFLRRLFSGFKDAKVDAIFKDMQSGKIGGRERNAAPSVSGSAKLAVAPLEDDNGRSEQARVAGAGRTGSNPVRTVPPLQGIPSIQGATGPDAALVSAAEDYARSAGIDYRRQGEYVEVDPELGQRLYRAYDEMAVSPEDPKVQEAYADLIRQTKAQFDALQKAGFEFTFFDQNTDPYDGNPFGAMRDLRANKRMAVYGTYDGYGETPITAEDIANNPMLEDTGLRWRDQSGDLKPVTANDLFRAVHDAFGHGLEGSGFRARGEENAWQAHRRLFTGAALGALTSETRGQNSYLNYGPHAQQNQTAKVGDTVFAPQKIGLMPEWTWNERLAPDYAEDVKFSVAPPVQSGEFKRWFKSSAAVNEDGTPMRYYRGDPKPLRGGELKTRRSTSEFGMSGGLDGEEGPFFFSPSTRFAEDYALNNNSKGGFGKASKRGVMTPVYLSVQNPFDYKNPEHRMMVAKSIAEHSYDYKDPSSLEQFFRDGSWEEIERTRTQRAIRRLGFDGFYVVEGGVRNLAIYSPTQAKSVFNQFEPGTAESRKLSIAPASIPRKEEDWAASGSPPPATDSQNQNGISPYRISQRVPRGAGREEEALANDLEISLDAMMLAENAFAHNATNVLKSYKILPPMEGTPEERARRYIRHFADNLLWLHDLVPANIRDRSKLWYDGARVIATQMAKELNIPDTAAAALIAAESPQKDWYQNVSLAKRISDTIVNHGDFEFDQDMLDKAKNLPAYKKHMPALNIMSGGATLNNMEKFLRQRKGNMLAAGEMTEDEFKAAVSLNKALFVRLYDETFRSKDYQIISPEGNEVGIATNKSGKPSRVAWGSFSEIAKGINVIEDPSKENINIRLGQKHKVRNFYNNIISPKAGSDITSDTHAVAAAHLKPLGGGATEVHHNFGTSKKGVIAAKNSGPFGVQGVYGLIADAYRLAAQERGILPREMQSITWEAIRGMYPAEMRRNKTTIRLVNEMWERYASGEITVDEARNGLLEITNGVKNPSWFQPDAGVYEDEQDTPNSGKLSGAGLRAGSDAGAIDGGAAGGDPASAAERGPAAAEIKTAKGIADSVAKSGEATQAEADMANDAVLGAYRKLSVAPIPAPMPAYLQQQNDNGLFNDVATPATTAEKIMAMFTRSRTADGRSKGMDKFRVQAVDKRSQLKKYTDQEVRAGRLNDAAEYSAFEAAQNFDRRSHADVNIMMNGAGRIIEHPNGGQMSRVWVGNTTPGEPSPGEVLQILLTGGPNGTSLEKQFRTYGVAQMAKARQAQGKTIPSQIDQRYIQEAEGLLQTYPELKRAFDMFQAFNKQMMQNAVDAGMIPQDLADDWTRENNYTSMYHQFEYEDAPQTPNGPSSIGANIRVAKYKGLESGQLMADPITAIMHNVRFWNTAITKNLAAQKAYALGKQVGIVDDLAKDQPIDPSKHAGVAFANFDGVTKRFAVSDPLFYEGLQMAEVPDMGMALELLGMPTQAIREMVTRDPGFMIANLLRDSVATWTFGGSDASPLDTFRGIRKALKGSSSLETLRSYAVIGSYDEASKSPEKFVRDLRRNIMAQSQPGTAGAMDIVRKGWDMLGRYSEASDAATRIAVFEAAKKNGDTDYTAAMKALNIMNFSRSGNSVALRALTRVIPFLNARIQGADVTYQGMKAGVNYLRGADQSAFEKQRGAKVFTRGMMMMAASVLLSMWNDDDEDYKQLPQYMKDANFIVPVGGGKFIQVPKPFEAGLFFATIPQALYDYSAGNRSGRSVANLFWGSFSSTMGFNPIPQFMLPALENTINHDMYTGMPLISPGVAKLDPSLQYNSSTTYVARAIGKLAAYTPFGYNMETGRFDGVSPIKIDNLISGYGGPIASYVTMALGAVMNAAGNDGSGLPTPMSSYPVVRRFFVDAADKTPASATEAYEIYQMVDSVNRTLSRLRKSGDLEGFKEYREENIDIIRNGKQVQRMSENLNNIRAQLRRLEQNTTMSGAEKIAKMRELRAREVTLTRKVGEVSRELGR